MFEFDWGSPIRARAIQPEESAEGAVRETRPQRVALTFWEEHCTECAVPECYVTCPLYEEREDGACVRLPGGIQRGPGGDLGPSATMRFAQWAKLTTVVPAGWVSMRSLRALNVIDRVLLVGSRSLTRATMPLVARIGWRVLNAYTWRRRHYLARLGTGRPRVLRGPEFRASVCNLGQRDVRLIFEYESGGVVRYRHAWTVPLGRSDLRLPEADSRFPAGESTYFNVYPDTPGAHLRFYELDFVEGYQNVSSPAPTRAAPVKCVAWDLDGTLWGGIVAESGGRALPLRDGARQVLNGLDGMGIIQTIVSRNTREDVIPYLEAAGIDHLFVFPSISWDPKSQQLRRVAGDLNIGLDAILLVDDSPFERAEVEAALPMVRTSDSADLYSVLRRDDLMRPSAEGRSRRIRYAEEEDRRDALAGYSDYRRFVADSKIELEIFVPTSEDDVTRCVELINRSNQLNLSGRRVSRETFDALSQSKSHVWLAGRCSDRFGNYGLVVVAGLMLDNSGLRLSDLCISCRVARRYVEQALIQWIISSIEVPGRTLHADLRATDRNQPLRDVFDDIGFAILPGGSAASLSTDGRVVNADVVAVSSAITELPLRQPSS